MRAKIQNKSESWKGADKITRRSGRDYTSFRTRLHVVPDKITRRNDRVVQTFDGITRQVDGLRGSRRDSHVLRFDVTGFLVRVSAMSSAFRA